MDPNEEDKRIIEKNHGPRIRPSQLVQKKRTFYWLNGQRQVLEGDSVADALMNGGYTAGALHALDFVANGECDDYVWIHGYWVLKYKSVNKL